MFEKEAEEYARNKMGGKEFELITDDDVSKYEETQKDWQDGAEFGFQKGIKAKINTTTISDCSIKDEWHYVKDGDLPKGESRVWLYFGVDDYNDGQFIRGRFWCGSYGWFDIEEVIAWKEIVPPNIEE